MFNIEIGQLPLNILNENCVLSTEAKYISATMATVILETIVARTDITFI